MVFLCIQSECVQLITEPYPDPLECEINRVLVTEQILEVEGITFFQVRCDEVK